MTAVWRVLAPASILLAAPMAEACTPHRSIAPAVTAHPAKYVGTRGGWKSPAMSPAGHVSCRLGCKT